MRTPPFTTLMPLVLLTGIPAHAEPPRAFEGALKESSGTFDALDEKGDWVDDLYGRAFFDMFPARRCRLTRDGAADAYTYACPASATNPQITARFEIDARRTGRLQATALSVTGQDTIDVVPVEPGTKAPFDFAAAIPVPPPPPALLPLAFRDAFRRGGNVYYERDALGPPSAADERQRVVPPASRLGVPDGDARGGSLPLSLRGVRGDVRAGAGPADFGRRARGAGGSSMTARSAPWMSGRQPAATA